MSTTAAKEEKAGPAVAGWGKRPLLSPAELPINDEALTGETNRGKGPVDVTRIPIPTLAVIFDRTLGGVRKRDFGHATPLSYPMEGRFGEWTVEPEGYPGKHRGRKGRFVVREKRDPDPEDEKVYGYARRYGYQGPTLVFASEGEAVEFVVREHRRRYEADRDSASSVARAGIEEKIRELKEKLTKLEHQRRAYTWLEETDLPESEVWYMGMGPQTIQVIERREVKATEEGRFRSADQRVQ